MECSICYCASVPALSRTVLFYFPPHLLVMSLTGCCFFFLPPSWSRFFSLFLSHTICSGIPVIDSEWVSSRVLHAGYYDNCGCAVGFKKNKPSSYPDDHWYHNCNVKWQWQIKPTVQVLVFQLSVRIVEDFLSWFLFFIFWRFFFSALIYLRSLKNGKAR